MSTKNPRNFYTRFTSPLCEIVLVGNEDGLTNLHLETEDGKRSFEIHESWEKNDEFFEKTKQQLSEFFLGKRKEFDLLLNPEGTDFQKSVWKALQNIPYGKLKTYKDIAEEIDNPKGYRAVGLANGKNPLPTIVPCHRVVGSDGSLTGFAFGTEIKEKLIHLESKNK